MLDHAPRRRWTLTEFLAWEERQELRHEFVDGEIRAMTGATVAHNIIALNLASFLRERLKGSPCRAYIGDVKVVIRPRGNVRYPDVMVDCGPYAANAQAAAAPTVIFEVLSKSTAWLDQTVKMEDYAAVDSIAHVVLIEQEQRRARIWSREGERLLPAGMVEKDGAVSLATLELTLPLDAVYEGVFDPEV